MELRFDEICEQLMNFRQDHSPASAADIKNEVNLAYHKLATERRWRELTVVDEAYQFTTGQKFLALPGDVATVYTISDRTNDFNIDKIDFDHLIRDNIAIEATNADVRQFSELGVKPIAAPLPADVNTQFDVVSDSASDTYGDIRVRGQQGTAGVGNNLIVASEIALNGTTTVNPAASFREGWSIHSITLTQTMNGTITVSEGTTTYAEIPPGGRSSRYYIVILETPSATASTLYVSYKRSVPRLIDDADVPIIPAANAIIDMVKGKLRQYDRRYVQAQAHMLAAQESVNSVLSEQRLQDTGTQYAQPEHPNRGFFRAY